jgi:hypothetical protein
MVSVIDTWRSGLSPVDARHAVGSAGYSWMRRAREGISVRASC